MGSTVAFLCGVFGLDEITLVNRTEKKAVGEALDISNAIAQPSSVSIRGTSDFAKIKGSDVVVIAASSRVHMQSRSEIMFEQAVMVTNIAKEIVQHCPAAKVVVVTNPVDVLTYLIQKQTNFEPQRVIGVASGLDSARFRYLLSEEFSTNQSEITGAMVLGEHDDSMVPIFSHAKFRARPVLELLDEQKKLEITLKVRNYWKFLRDYKGSSVFGIAKHTFDVVKCIISAQRLFVPASTLLLGQYGLDDVCVGVPLEIGKNGVEKIHQIQINKDEFEALHNSAGVVKNNIERLFKFLRANNLAN